ncbi:MAG: lysophospholipid acyltransferase family protein [Bacteroidota bacterium]
MTASRSWGQRIAYGCWWGVIQVLSRIPIWGLYRLSDGLFLLIYGGLGYRKKVVYDNLRQCFPDWEEAELHQQTRRFYRHFCDVIVETIKSFSISDQALAKRVELVNPEIAEDILAQPGGSLLLASHYGNFEWMCARLDLMSRGRIPTYAVYNPFSSQVFDDLITWMRQRRGLKMRPMRYAMIDALRTMREVSLYGFIFDQSPHRGGPLYFSEFLGRPTAFHTSVAKLALRAKARVYYADVEKVGRGRYRVELKILDPMEFLPATKEHVHAFTDLQIQALQQTIERDPAFWLWSHKRWKLKPDRFVSEKE